MKLLSLAILLSSFGSTANAELSDAVTKQIAMCGDYYRIIYQESETPTYNQVNSYFLGVHVSDDGQFILLDKSQQAVRGTALVLETNSEGGRAAGKIITVDGTQTEEYTTTKIFKIESMSLGMRPRAPSDTLAVSSDPVTRSNIILNVNTLKQTKQVKDGLETSAVSEENIACTMIAKKDQ